MTSAAADANVHDRPCLLGIARSVTGKRWESRVDNDRLARALAQQHDLSDVVARVMVGRGVRPEHAQAYLNPSLRDDLPDPSQFQDMDAAAARLADAVGAGEPVAVFGDYDVDGGASAALVARVLRWLGVETRIYIPDRCSEGYGPKVGALQTLREEGHRLVICVDCGTTAFEPLAAAADIGLETLVVDHHTAEPRLPTATAVVNPNRIDESGAHGQLAAVGVTFLLLVALNRTLRARGVFTHDRREPDLRQWLDLVALGTVCDVVPLTGVNRALVARGLEIMAKRRNPGIAALCDVARLDSAPGPFHLGFMLGPRINAGGRIGRSDMGAHLLATDMPGEAERLARELDRLNAERKDMEAEVLAQAEAQVAAEGTPEGLVFAAGDGWHPGVIGIVASRLVEKYDVPAIVVGLDDNGTGKGSGRSVRGVDMGSAVIAGRQAGVLREGGGHAMAAGLTVDANKLDVARDFLRTRLADALAESGFVPAFGFDGALQPAGATLDLVRTLERLGPFGTGNPEPRFALPNVRVQGAQTVGGDGQHVRCTLLGADGARLKAIAFKAGGTALGDALLKADGVARHVAGKLRVDSWSGKDRVQLIVEDAATPA
jgi:single-stranded-DNA-specific exonuclease